MSKPFYASKTFWGAILMLVSAVSLKLGHEIVPTDAALYVDLASAIGEVAGLGLTIYGRAMAKGVITIGAYLGAY
jgi:hypothetical protein